MVRYLHLLISCFICTVLVTGSAASAAMTCCPTKTESANTTSHGDESVPPCHAKPAKQENMAKKMGSSCGDGGECELCKHCVKSTPTVEASSSGHTPPAITPDERVESVPTHRPESISPPPRHS